MRLFLKRRITSESILKVRFFILSTKNVVTGPDLIKSEKILIFKNKIKVWVCGECRLCKNYIRKIWFIKAVLISIQHHAFQFLVRKSRINNVMSIFVQFFFVCYLASISHCFVSTDQCLRQIKIKLIHKPKFGFSLRQN